MLHKEQTSKSLLHMGQHMLLIAPVGLHHWVCTAIVSVLQLVHTQQKKVNIYQYHWAMVVVREKFESGCVGPKFWLTSHCSIY